VKSGAANVGAALGYVAHPPVRVVVLFAGRVRDFQVLHLQAGHVVHGDLELHRDRPHLLPTFGGVALFQSDSRCEHVFDAALELVDGPVDTLFTLLVLELLSLDTLGQFA